MNKTLDLIKQQVAKESINYASKEELSKFLGSYRILDNQTFLKSTYPEAKWIVDQLVRDGGISFLVGESGTGKSITTLSMAKAISEEKPWLDKFPTHKRRILILDKENTPGDVQKLQKSMGVVGDGIYHLNETNEDYALLDENFELTDFSLHLKEFIKLSKIQLIILDSVIDFMIGDENSSVDVKSNINKWKEIFPDCSIIGIHHEGKTPPSGRREAKDRIRGSGHWMASAQSILSLSVINAAHPERLMVEHTKVRGGKKCRPFEIEMIIRDDPFHKGETVVDGFKYIKEMSLAEVTIEKAQEAILNLLATKSNWIKTKEIKTALMDKHISGKNGIDSALKYLVEENQILLDDSGKTYLYKINTGGVSKIIDDLAK